MENWVAGVKTMAVFERGLPQMSYARLMMSLQKYWNFYNKATPVFGPLFAPLEESLKENFTPDLLGVRREEVTESLCKRITWGVKWLGIGIPYPTHTTPTNV